MLLVCICPQDVHVCTLIDKKQRTSAAGAPRPARCRWCPARLQVVAAVLDNLINNLGQRVLHLASAAVGRAVESALRASGKIEVEADIMVGGRRL